MPIIAANAATLLAPGNQVSGGILSPGDIITADFVVQGYLTPTGASLTGTMSTAAWPASAVNVAVAIVSRNRVFHYAGESALTFTYTANKDTYNDLDYNGTIYHTAVNNGAGAPALATSTCLRLEKVVTNATTITTVTRLATTIPTLSGSFTRYTSTGQTITAGGSLTLAHGFTAAIPRKIWYDLECATAELGYSVGQRVAAQTVTGKNGAGPAMAIVADATNLNIRFNNSSPVFQICNFTTGAQVNITNSSWVVVFYVEL